MKIINLPKEKKFSKKKYHSGTMSFPLELKSIPDIVYNKLMSYIYKAISQRLEKNQKIRNIRISHIEFNYSADNINNTKTNKR